LFFEFYAHEVDFQSEEILTGRAREAVFSPPRRIACCVTGRGRFAFFIMPEPIRSRVKDLKTMESGVAFDGVFLLKKRAVKTAKNGNPFMMAEFGDRTGSFSVTLFADSAAYAAVEASQEGSAVRLEGRSDRYNDKFSPKLFAVAPLDPADLANADALDGLVESSPEEAEALWSEFHEHIAAISHPGLRATVEAAFAEVGETFRTSSAAVAMHHAYRNGLLEHTVHMARACRALLPLYPEVEPSLALAGILLHDTGKVVEYTQGMTTKRTRTGILQGHVVLGYALTRKHGLRSKLDPSLLERLEHIVLSHQGELEWGAAAMAATPEAVFVSLIDNLDAKMGMVQKVLREAPEGAEFSDFIPGLKAPVLLTPPNIAVS
jgi:3'-5' exoribonuclease